MTDGEENALLAVLLLIAIVVGGGSFLMALRMVASGV